ncbi:hypothetical protein CR513_34852, partial [Mucuna pruriens]
MERMGRGVLQGILGKEDYHPMFSQELDAYRHQNPELPNPQANSQGNQRTMAKGLRRKIRQDTGLLKVEVQPHALAVLAQFYDVHLRCFTFRDFQLTPALEEYERILGMPIKEPTVYFHKGYLPSWGVVAELLRKPEAEVRRIKKAKNGVEGLPREYLENQAVVDTLALLIYGIVLFLQLEDYVDLAAVDVFLEVKEKNENLVPAMLADTYYTLNCCLSKRGKNLRCYIHALYLWMTAHYCPGKCKTRCPIEDYKWGCIKTMSREEWIHHFMGLSQGCSNYNPALALKQNGYPILAPPTEESLTLLEVHGRDMQNAEWFWKIRQTWKQVTRMGPEYGPRSCGATTSYKDWLQKRIRTNELPFERVPQDPRTRFPFKTSDPPIVLKERRLYEQARQEADKEKELRLRMGDYLKVANQEMCLRRKEKDQAAGEKESLKEALQNARRKEVELKGEIEVQHKELLRERSRREAAEAKENQALNELATERREAENKRHRAWAIVAELQHKITRKESKHQELTIQAGQRIKAVEEATEY